MTTEHNSGKHPVGNPGGLAAEIEAHNIRRAQQIAADVHRELPDDTELDVAFAEFKRRLRTTR